ncbi:hypothetical protein [Paenibacillus sacheonensis]|uniref:DNA topology modulation protein FlaR n=1 Tax=Paenibacillus sacheonensis TaxID=742054 RepID=A0A7X4YRC5_9BACL|nr:hypothetical protein [Paenibacillus sacheonensis]MBM7565008.1 adenylate kinase family enzyme [Paenibacillus sacheonensis]NBC70206.1 hypothetical protein [Paenibacillus sacheonensis]
MRKVLIIGIVASGKTTFAKRLSQTLDVPWYELDAIVYHKTSTGRHKRTAAEQVEEIMAIDNDGAWIFEGTDRASYQCLYQMADTIIFLDPPLRTRRIRILTRYLKQKLGIEKCHYKPDLKMLRMMYRWTSDFERNREGFEGKLERYKEKLIRVKDTGRASTKFARDGSAWNG